jgi:ankyrin repeat protein
MKIRQQFWRVALLIFSSVSLVWAAGPGPENTVVYVSSGKYSNGSYVHAGGTACCSCIIEHQGNLPTDFAGGPVNSVTFFLKNSLSSTYYRNKRVGATSLAPELGNTRAVSRTQQVAQAAQLPVSTPWQVTFAFAEPVDVSPGTRWKLTDGDNNWKTGAVLHASDERGPGLPGTSIQKACKYSHNRNLWYSVSFSYAEPRAESDEIKAPTPPARPDDRKQLVFPIRAQGEQAPEITWQDQRMQFRLLGCPAGSQMELTSARVEAGVVHLQGTAACPGHWLVLERKKGDAWERITEVKVFQNQVFDFAWPLEPEPPSPRSPQPRKKLVSLCDCLVFGYGAETHKRNLLKQARLGANINPRCRYGVTPLAFAISYWQDPKLVSELLALGASAQLRVDYYGGYPLNMAARIGSMEITNLLLGYGADPMAKGSKGKTPLHDAARKGHVVLAQLYLDKGIAIGVQDEEGARPLDEAAAGGHIAMIRLLVARGADVNAVGGKKGAPLHWAAGGGNAAAVGKLLALGAILDKEADGVTAMHVAAGRGHAEVVKLLVEKGIAVDRRVGGDSDYTGATALHLAAYGGEVDVVRALIEKGADVDLRVEGVGKYARDTALHLAVAKARKKTVAVLIAAGANVNIRNSAGKRPADIATEKGLEEISRMLSAKPEK